MQDTPIHIIVGSHVWVEDSKEAWIDGEVMEIKGHQVKVQTVDGKLVSKQFYFELQSL